MADLDIIEINEELTKAATYTASSFDSSATRKRGMVDLLGLNCAVKYLEAQNLIIDTKQSIHKIPKLFEEFKINDIYFNNWQIDVITIYKENAIKIPRVHLDCDILPDFYFVVQIGSKMIEAKMIGFIDAKDIINAPCDEEFCYPSLDKLLNLDDFKILTKRSAPPRKIVGKHAEIAELFLKFMDGTLSDIYKSQLINHLMTCRACRAKFVDTVEFEKMAKNLEEYPDLMEKYEENEITPIKSIASEVLTYNPQSTEEIEFPVFASEPYENKSFEPQKEENDATGNNETKELKDTEETVEAEDFANGSTSAVIEDIFDEERHIEIPASSFIHSRSKRSIILIAGVLVFFVLFAIISLGNLGNMKKQQENLESLNEFDGMQGVGNLYDEEYGDEHFAQPLPKNTNVGEFLMSQTKTAKASYSPSVGKIAWEVPQSLAKKPEYQRFLQLTGKNVKLNLQNELLLVHDVPANKLMTVVIKISPLGEVTNVNLLQTSGSQQIDDSVIKVVNDTLQYVKPPSQGIISKPVQASLAIELN